MWNDRYSPAGLSLWGRVSLDPGTLMLGSLAASAIGGGISAMGTLAGGANAAALGQYEAGVDKANASQAFASGQRQMFDSQLKTRMLLSTARADAAGNGTNAGTGSAAAIQGAIAKRGSYNAAMDMFNGESASTSLLNKANTDIAGGEMQQEASDYSAAGTIAGSAGSMLKTYGSFAYPQSFRA